MKAIVIDEYGGPEVLRYTDHEDPKMGTEGGPDPRQSRRGQPRRLGGS